MRIKVQKPIFDFRKKKIFRIFFKNFKVPLLDNGGVHSNGARKHTTRSWYEPTSQVFCLAWTEIFVMDCKVMPGEAVVIQHGILLMDVE